MIRYYGVCVVAKWLAGDLAAPRSVVRSLMHVFDSFITNFYFLCLLCKTRIYLLSSCKLIENRTDNTTYSEYQST